MLFFARIGLKTETESIPEKHYCDFREKNAKNCIWFRSRTVNSVGAARSKLEQGHSGDDDNNGISARK